MSTVDQDEEDTVLAVHDAELLRVLAESSASRYIVEVQAVHSDRLAKLVDPLAESTRVLAEALHKNGGTLVSIVPGGAEAQRQAEARASRLEAAGLRPAHFLTGDAVAQLAALTLPVDLLFLAGEIDYTAALQAAMPRLRPGSLVVAHHARTDAAFLDAIHADLTFETTVLEQGAGLTVSLRKGY